MLTEQRNKRRDARVPVPEGTGSIEFDAGSGRRKGGVSEVSASGLSFDWSGDESLEPNTTFRDVVVRVGRHEIAGDLSTRGTRRPGPRASYGCIFYPASLSDGQAWERALEELGALPRATQTVTGDTA